DGVPGHADRGQPAAVRIVRAAFETEGFGQTVRRWVQARGAETVGTGAKLIPGSACGRLGVPENGSESGGGWAGTWNLAYPGGWQRAGRHAGRVGQAVAAKN